MYREVGIAFPPPPPAPPLPLMLTPPRTAAELYQKQEAHVGAFHRAGPISPCCGRRVCVLLCA